MKKSYPSNKIRRNRFNLPKSNSVSKIRVRLVFYLLVACISGLISRMAWLQIFQAPVLQAEARSRQIQKIQPLGKRRSIVDRNGRLVAIDEQRFRLWAHPRYFNFPGDNPRFIRDPIDVARKLSSSLSLSTYELVRLMGTRASGVRLSESIDQKIASEIKSFGISGLDLEPYLQRVYPQGNLFANVVGFLNLERIPQAGLEQSLNKELLRNEKTRILRLGADGTPLPDDLAPGSFIHNDSPLELTLDARLQELAVNALNESIAEWDAKKGVAIVMNVNNGELLALASTPTYDPNNYWEFSPDRFKEWSVQDLFEPGSTFKPINLALALEERVIEAQGTVNDTGRVTIGGWPIYNHDQRPNGLIDYATVLQVSSNVGMVKIMRKLEPSNYWDWLHRLGIDSWPETDLPGAASGQLKTKDQFISQSIEPAVTSYGQGFSLTPLKLAQLHAFIANGGYLISPRITQRAARREFIRESSSENRSPLLRSDVSEIVLGWMESVVQKGSGMGVRTPGYRIGGKTGTAEKVVNGAYQAGVKICSFVATLPIEKPKYVVLVVVDEPKGSNAYGSTVAVPVAKKIIDGLLVLEKIPPSTNKTILLPAKG